MAANDQNEFGLPTSKNEPRTTASLLPRIYRTSSNQKFLQATLDQLTQPGTVKKINGYIGRQNSKAVSKNDIFLEATDATRQNYQLEPAAVITDYLGNVNFFKDYIDHINHVDTSNGIVSNHERLNRQEFYSWNPHIDWDKFVNYRNYYWLPTGPTPIEVSGQGISVSSTYTVDEVDNLTNYTYMFTPDGVTANPTITLYRGQTYTFDVTAPNNPFSIKTKRSTGDLDRYTEGVSANGVTTGKLTFKVPVDAPNVLFYSSENDLSAGGAIRVLTIDQNTFLDVDKDIIGKKSYTLHSGVSLSNGMKLKFTGLVQPSEYAQGYWYVEGVGSAINLVSERNLEIVSSYSEDITILFDDNPFDQTSFSSATTYSKNKDYLVVNRASPDQNLWSRYNRWFHEDVIAISDSLAGDVPNLDQTARATRPIIEFESGLKLFNFGHQAKADIDLIDFSTDDAFSKVEGSLGYSVDGVSLSEGMRVIFAAESDALVKNKIYQVNFITINKPSYILDFLGSTSINQLADTIKFAVPHRLTSGNAVIYRNNGNPNVSGLLNSNTYYVSVVDGYTVKLYSDKQLTRTVDILAKSSGTHHLDVTPSLRRQIHLVEATDAEAVVNETVMVRQGKTYQGKMFWYNGTDWKLGPVKTQANQPPLFDIVDNAGYSYGDYTVYNGSTFTGSKVFSYKVSSTGVTDTELGFALTHQNINNIGDILFEFNLLTDSFSYKNITEIVKQSVDVGSVILVNSLNNTEYSNGWTTSKVTKIQPIIRIFKDTTLTNNFPIDVFDDVHNLDDLEVRVFINGIRLTTDLFSVETLPTRKYVKLATDAKSTDVVSLKLFSNQPKNLNGYYEIPISLQNNPLNDNISYFTLGEVNSHVDTIVENLTDFQGVYPGNGNLRDLGNITPYGVKFVQHSSPLSLSLYHLGSKDFNILKSLQQARNDYGKFKRAFIITATNSGIDTDTRRHVDYILNSMFENKSKSEPYYFSDMFGHGAYNKLEYVVDNPRVTRYPITNLFNLSKLSNKAVNVYINGEQLLHGRDYTFGDDHYVTFHVELVEDALIEMIEYVSTDGAYCPATPSKLGLYPVFEPCIFEDTTYLEPQTVIQGHDGSITIAFGDYRDQLILELEKRIFNNIKINYDVNKFNIYDFIPGYSRNTEFTRQEFEQVLGTFFYQWTSLIGQDFTKPGTYDRLNPFTFNYRDNYTPAGKEIPAYWRGIFNYLLNTDRPHTHPWECLEYSIEPQWWQEVYGPAPYTDNNKILWDDIRQGIIRDPAMSPRKVDRLAKTILQYGTPVDENGNLKFPTETGFVDGIIKPTAEGYYTFGDQGPVETAWRRSSYHAFAVIQTVALLQPSKVIGVCFDLSRTARNQAGQLVYTETGLRIKLEDIVIPTLPVSNSRVYSSGLVNYIVDSIASDSTALLDSYASDLQNLKIQIGSKLGGFTAKEKFNLILDSKNPNSTGGVFVPQENYNIFLNTSSPIKKLNYSGLIITKYADGFELKGYNFEEPFFKYHSFDLNDRVINVGGISETYLTWTSGRTYVAGSIVKNNNNFYRVTTTFTSKDTFDTDSLAKLPTLPMTGGVEVIIRKNFRKENTLILSYGTKLKTIQEVADFIQGYGAYLESEGFTFDTFNTNLQLVSNWETSLKEFLFWTTQNWGAGAVISLSPSASLLTINVPYAVVNDILDPFYEYKIFKVDGTQLEHQFTSIVRDNNTFSLQPFNTNHGIYGATLYLIQKEHAMLLDNRTLFNDIIYDLAPGIRQDRIKALGYITKSWNGGFSIPGFIFDEARIEDWQMWTDYALGSVVKYGAFYYSALNKVAGAINFDETKWNRLLAKPTKSLKPNWDYRSQQFTDFYDLDTDNFDKEQQVFAQHLIGYQKRNYLENIIQDDVSQYNFYQGYIREKGTLNSLSKLFDVLSAEDKESLSFTEEWAVRVGQYGASAGFKEIEFVLDESQFKLNPQPVELVSEKDANLIDFVYRQVPSEVYIKPQGYNNNPWPVDGTIQYLRSPGYVRHSDVAANVDTLDDLVGTSITNIEEGDYIWTAFENAISQDFWGIYRLTNSNSVATAISYANNNLTITFNNRITFVAGQVIGLVNPSYLSGFYKITSVHQNKIVINTKLASWTDVAIPEEVLVFELTSSKIDSVNNLNTVILPSIKQGELVWANDNGLGQWAVYKNDPVYNDIAIDSSTKTTNLNFGKHISLSQDGTKCAVVQADGVAILTKTPASTVWGDLQTLVETTPSRTDVTSVKFSPDNNIIVVAYGSNAYNNALSFVRVYEKTITGFYNLVYTIANPMPNLGDYVSRLDVVNNGTGSYIIAVSTTVVNTFYTYDYQSTSAPSQLSTNISGSGINSAIVKMSDRADTVVVSTAFNNTVRVYKKNDNNEFIQTQVLPIVGATVSDKFGYSVDISKDAQTIAVGSPLFDGTSINSGNVHVYDLVNNQYVQSQIITGTKKEASEQYGTSVQFMNSGKSLVILSGTGTLKKTVSMDKYSRLLADATIVYGTKYINDPSSPVLTNSTTFDNSSTTFEVTVPGGRVDVYDRYDKNFIYGESLTSKYVGNNVDSLSATDGYGSSISVGNNTIVVGAPYHDTADNENIGRLYSYYKTSGTYSWTPLYQQVVKPNVFKIKKAILYNKSSQQLIRYLDIVDPNQGKIPGIADQEIKFKSYFDPAIYSVGTSAVNVNDGIKWNTDKVGMLWWDLSRAKFLENNIGEVVYRSTTWNKLYDTASIDVYEWVGSKYLPSEWDKLADTEKGLTQNVSGKSKYGDSIYSVVQTYDTVSKKFINVYYYWVKNKTIVPKATGRTLSASEIANLIADPVGYGYPALVLTGTNSFSLVNVKNDVKNKDVVLSVQYWTIDNQEINVHGQWKIINQTDTTALPAAIETKWIHSLIGKDENNRSIPDIALPGKQRYGIEFRPRQSMFINRGEALKLFIEKTNAVLAENLITDNYDISDLLKNDPAPSAVSGKWDVKIAANELLKFISTGSLEIAELTPSIENGKIVDVIITNAGKGYGKLQSYAINELNDSYLWYGPYVSINGIGDDALVRTIINSLGQVVSVKIINPGSGYSNATTFTVRPFSALIESDANSYNLWAIYNYDIKSSKWIKVKSQTYNVQNFWNYIDWYATGYNEFTKVNYKVENTYELTRLESKVGDVVKVTNIGTGGWVLLKKYADNITVDYTQNYTTIGRENGTIKFSSSLYDFKNAIVGFDSNLYDTAQYDNFAVAELRIIIDAIRYKILINSLRSNYIDLFFSSIRYILNEQPFVDWVLKTSFIKAMHNVGGLKQKVTYNNDNLQDFESYIDEVKPFRTNIREFVSSYTTIDLSNTMVSDFDIIPFVDNDYNIQPVTLHIEEVDENTANIVSSSTVTEQYPWKNWIDNVGFTITSIEVSNGGSGYINPPIVRITGGYGSGATAKAYISNGSVNRVTITTPGKGYLKAPTVILDGGLNANGVQATAVAIIRSEVIRSNKISMKFDRITKNYFVYEIEETETLKGTGSRLQFDLKYSPIKTIGRSKVTINGIDVLRNEYKFATKKSTSRGFTSYYGSLTLSSPPADKAVIVVTYEKDFNHLSAADRINFFYSPETGQWGKDLSQLMTGIDYGGVNITGLGFNSVGGWDALPWFTDSWDSVDQDYDNYVTITAQDDHVITLPYVPADGQELNIYINRLETLNFTGDNSTVDYLIPNSQSLPNVKINNTEMVLNKDYTLITYSISYRTLRFTVAPALNSNVVIEVYKTEQRLDDYAYSLDPYRFTWHGAPLYSIAGSPFFDPITKTEQSDLISFDGASYISAPQATEFDFGTRNFTIELFVRADVLSVTDWTLILSIGGTTGGKEISIGQNINATGVGFIIPNNSNNSNVYYGAGQDLLIGSWQHLALVRDGNHVYFFVDGVKVHTINSVSFNFRGLGPLQLGHGVDGYFAGGVSNLRILKGTALYTSDFMVPTAPLTQISNTVLLELNTHATNENAVMRPFIGDGVVDQVTIPSHIAINDKDKIIVRKLGSDGSSVINLEQYDTQLNGGAFEGTSYTTATGVAPDDINIDGDGFVTTTNSAGPEELLPGQVFDSVAIKVYHRPSGGSPKILFRNYITSGQDESYQIGQFSPTERSVIVKLDGEFLEVDQYTINWKTNSISLTTTPTAGQLVSIVSSSFNASNILDTDYFIGDGTTTEFITKAPWLTEVNATVLVDGSIANYELFRTDSTYELSNVVGIRFATAISDSSIVNYIIDTDPIDDVTKQTASVMRSQMISFVAGTSTYNLTNLTATDLTSPNLQPYSNNILVRKGQEFLQPAKILNFVLGNDNLSYTLSPYEATASTFDITQLKVFVAGIELTNGKDFIVDFFGVTIVLNQSRYIDGAPMVVVISSGADYSVNSNGQIIFTNDYTTNTQLEVITFFNHATLAIERSVNLLTPATELVPSSAEYFTFTKKLGKRFKTDKYISTDDYVWIIKNGKLLSHGAEYSLEKDHHTVRLRDTLIKTDVVQVIAFSSNVVTHPVSYMQFKDILNRVHFKRLNKNKQTTLMQDLKYDDLSIMVSDASNFDVPNVEGNKPGIIEIRGERIEFFEINGNELTRLRRGTLGTGVSEVHRAGAKVIDIGASETLPYAETELIEKIRSDGTKIIPLTFKPTKGYLDSNISIYDPTGVEAWFSNLGYTYLGEYSAATTYLKNSIVVHNNAYYVSILTSKGNSTSNATYWAQYSTEVPVGYGQSNDIEVFVGGYDLTTEWATETSYALGDLITKGAYHYKCVIAHTSSKSFKTDQANWKMFLGNIHLRKQPTLVNNLNTYVYSPEGDHIIDADFAVDGVSNAIRLTNELAVGTTVTVVRKTGKNWDNALYGDNKIAGFLREAPAIWYSDFKQD